jgi:ribosome biogenesis GTPase
MIDIKDYGYNPSLNQENTAGLPARVTAVHKERYELICEHGVLYAKLKSSVYYDKETEAYPTAGDFVLIDYNPDGDSRIIKTLPRKSKFARNDFSGHAAGYVKTVLEQVVAANFDYVFILMSLNLNFNIKRLERYLTLAWQSGGIPVIVLTKADLIEDFSDKLRLVEASSPGIPIFAVSARTGYGLSELSGFLKPRKTIVFLGSSGVGKSSLVNALEGREVMYVGEIREEDSRGRHTTTHRQLIMLSSGVMIIDTPGMRELGMWDVTTGLGEAFSDVEAFLGRCRFSDCRHETEPGCAVKQAIIDGKLSRERWDSYLSLKREARFTDDKSGAIREKEEWLKSISKLNKQYKNIKNKR